MKKMLEIGLLMGFLSILAVTGFAQDRKEGEVELSPEECQKVVQGLLDNQRDTNGDGVIDSKDD